MCSPFFLLPFFFLILTESSLCGKQSGGVLEEPALSRPWKQMWLVPCCWGMKPFRVAIGRPHFSASGVLARSYPDIPAAFPSTFFAVSFLFPSSPGLPSSATFSFGSKMTEGISRLEATSSHSLPTHDSDKTDLCSSAKPKNDLLPDPTVWMHDPNIFVNNIVKSQEACYCRERNK